jgi:hypothetical protein
VADGTAEGRGEQHCQGSDPDSAFNDCIGDYIGPAYEHKVCNLTAAHMGVNETGMCLEMLECVCVYFGVLVSKQAAKMLESRFCMERWNVQEGPDCQSR